MLNSVKEILTKEVEVKDLLEMEVEMTKLKQVLATEVKLKEFLVQEIDLKSFLSNTYTNSPSDLKAHDERKSDSNNDSIEPKVNAQKDKTIPKVKKKLPAFDFTLINDLSAEHKRIRFVFNKIMSFAIEKDYKKVAGQLEAFNKEIRSHYQKTDVELYAYLKTYVQLKYPKREKAFTELSLEMKNISIEIFYIITQSPNVPLRDESYNAFMKEFMLVGKMLNERINKEQNLLFKMYEQTNAVKSIS